MQNQNHVPLWGSIALGVVLFSVSPLAVSQGKKGQPETVAGEISAISNLLATRPPMAIDFTEVSGEYCLNGGLGKGGHMTHYAVDPTKSQEDIIDFVNAKMMMDAGINVQDLPKHSSTLGSMTPGQWYFLSANAFEPHHGKQFPMPMMMRATDVQPPPPPAQ